MKRFLLVALTASGISASADVAISLRYFQGEGVSHYHLFLFRDDGELIRQLTSPEHAHDVSPKWIENGKAILFVRKQGKVRQIWKIGSDGRGLRQLAKPPAGFPVTKYPRMFVAHEAEQKLNPPWEPAPTGFRMTVPGQKLELLRTVPVDDDGGVHREATTFQTLTLRDLETDLETLLATDRGDETWRCGWMTAQGAPFLRQEGLSAAFFYQAYGSSAGYRVGAIDFLGKRIVNLTEENPAHLIPHGQRPGFFSLCEERYQDLPGTELSVNCLYLDWWDKEWHRHRFSRALSLFGGASIRVPGQPQLEIPYDANYSGAFETNRGGQGFPQNHQRRTRR